MRTSQDEARRGAPYLDVIHLAAGYKNLPVIRDVCASVAKGEVVVVIGPNGAGKSTLLKAVMGVLPPMAGTITLGGEPIGGLRADQVACMGVGYVPQVRDVFEALSVKENLEMGGYQLHRREIHGRIEEVVDAFPQLGSLLGRSASNLSGGERKMVAIGRVLMTRPGLVILDEPTAGLSPKLAHQMLADYVGRLCDRGVGVLLVEQRAREALQIADFAYVMASGEIKIATTASRVLELPDLGEIFLGRAVSLAP